MGNRAAKGSDFERELCVEFSKWWTNGEREDIFWRCGGSGGRAKVRGNSGRSTAGQHGDIAATDPMGAPLIRLLTIELKRGYNTATPYDTIDRPKTAAVGQWEKFILQTTLSWKQSGSYAWLLITRRDRRRAFVYMPEFLLEALNAVGAFSSPPKCFLSFATNIREKSGPVRHQIYGVPLTTWLSGVQREHIEQLAAEW